MIDHPRHPGPEQEQPEQEQPEQKQQGVRSDLKGVAELNEAIANPQEGDVLLYSAGYCGPCNQLENQGVYDQIAANGNNIKKFDVSTTSTTLNSPVKGGPNIASIPRAFVYEDAQWKVIGKEGGFNDIRKFAK